MAAVYADGAGVSACDDYLLAAPVLAAAD